MTALWGKRVRITDTTLRDGSHALAHQFSGEDVEAIARGLDEAGVEVIEVSHGDGLGGSSVQYGFSRVDERELIERAARVIRQAKLAVLLLPGIGTQEDLKIARDLGATVARIATHCTEADIGEQHVGLAKKLGMEAVGFLMMAHMIEPEELVRQAKIMEDAGADCVYVTDSAGALEMDGARERVRALHDGLRCQVGFHAHNNLGLSVANTLVAIEEGAAQVDGSARGLGAGAGNTPTEVLVAVLNKVGVAHGIDLWKIMDVAEELVAPIQERPCLIDRASLTLGYAGVYGSFLLHAYRASERFDVDAREILVECGRRKTVGGQEDMIIDIAAELSAGRKAHSSKGG